MKNKILLHGIFPNEVQRTIHSLKKRSLLTFFALIVGLAISSQDEKTGTFSHVGNEISQNAESNILRFIQGVQSQEGQLLLVAKTETESGAESKENLLPLASIYFSYLNKGFPSLVLNFCGAINDIRPRSNDVALYDLYCSRRYYLS